VSLGNRVGKETLGILQALYPKARYYSGFSNNFNGLLFNLALEQLLNFKLSRVEECFECVINGTFYQIDWTDLTFEILFPTLKIKPKLCIVQSIIGRNFHEMLLHLQDNSKVSGNLVSDRLKV
jgi:hypothetical protein